MLFRQSHNSVCAQLRKTYLWTMRGMDQCLKPGCMSQLHEIYPGEILACLPSLTEFRCSLQLKSSTRDSSLQRVEQKMVRMSVVYWVYWTYRIHKSGCGILLSPLKSKETLRCTRWRQAHGSSARNHPQSTQVCLWVHDRKGRRCSW